MLPGLVVLQLRFLSEDALDAVSCTMVPRWLLTPIRVEPPPATAAGMPTRFFNRAMGAERGRISQAGGPRGTSTEAETA
jgi:hypothetical protein